MTVSDFREVAAGLHACTAGPGELERWRLHNPARRNAVTPDALRWMTRRCALLERQIVVLGSSSGPFCSGFDLQALASALHSAGEGGQPLALPDEVLIEATDAMRNANALFIAALRDYAIGAGVELFACCDLRVVSDDAYLQIPAARLGVVYHARGIEELVAQFGPAVATRLLCAADKIEASALQSANLVRTCCARDEVDAHAEALAKQLAALDADAVHSNLKLIRASARGPIPAPLLAQHDHARIGAYARARLRGPDKPGD